jgi:hypothetical protein
MSNTKNNIRYIHHTILISAVNKSINNKVQKQPHRKPHITENIYIKNKLIYCNLKRHLPFIHNLQIHRLTYRLSHL